MLSNAGLQNCPHQRQKTRILLVSTSKLHANVPSILGHNLSAYIGTESVTNGVSDRYSEGKCDLLPQKCSRFRVSVWQ